MTLQTTMHSAVVNSWGESPKYIEVDKPQPGTDDVLIKVEAVGVHSLVRARAAGTHYSSGVPPHTVGTDGVGKTEDGKQVFFSTLKSGGSFSDYVVVSKSEVAEIPNGVDPVQVAAFLNPAFSSWMAIKRRTFGLPKQFTILILGVTSTSGSIAIQIARFLGAKKVIGCARNEGKMKSLDLDEFVIMQESPQITDFSHLKDVDLVLDYVSGQPVSDFFNTFEPTKSLQFVHIGQLSGPLFSVKGPILREHDISIRGSGIGSWKLDELSEELPGIVSSFISIPPKTVDRLALKDIESTWSNKSNERTVYLP